MEYTKQANKIIIKDLSQFNTKQILDCGQIFRYFIKDDIAEVVSGNNYAQIITFTDRVEIVSENIEYFEHFFDLKNDYNEIKKQLVNDEFLAESINFGYGIRILNQQLFEMIVSFIISANNNIKRIKNSLNYLSEKFGTKKQINIDVKSIQGSPLTTQSNKIEYYAFPSLAQLKKATVEDFISAGLGYRAQYMYDTIQKLDVAQLNNFITLTDEQQLQFLLSLKGIGEKVAHCILLFSMHQTNVFPVDTWINKVYNDLTCTNSTNRKQISKELSNKYGALSGYAQQYFFYYYRSNK